MMKQTINSPIRKFKLLLVLPLIAGIFYAFATPEYKYAPSAQEELLTILDTRTIKGKVVNEEGVPLKGASVVISEKTIGTITDNEGNFVLQMTDDSPLVISYVGYESQKVTPSLVIPSFDQKMLISLKKVPKDIGEVVVIGYGNNSQQSSSIQQPITIKVQGQAPFHFRNSDGSATQPLVIIDGVIADNQNASNIDPASIQSISILKDASATAVYGDKGKNGVILITLKKGSDFKNEPIDLQITGTATDQQGEKVYSMVEQMPEFPGGDQALRRFIATSVRYPVIAQENNIQGKVYVSFVVSKTGIVTSARITRGVDPSLDREALRVVNSLPAWTPGKQKGENVAVEYTIPISFALQSGKTNETNTPDNPVFFIVEEMPTFPGGDEALRNFIALTVKYPAEAHQKGIHGKVYINFVVTKTGSIANAKVARGVDPLLDQEAIRVINLLPTWKPGKQGGKNVDVSYTVPINFTLEPSKISDEQLKSLSNESNPVFFIVEEMPTFPGGDETLRNFIALTVKYPTEAHQKGIQGKVYINFVVTKTGSIANAKVARGVDPLLDQEAIRVINSLPTWSPGKQGGKNVDVSYTIPINFALEEESKKEGSPMADPTVQKKKLIIVPNPSQSVARVTLEGSDSTNKLEVSILSSFGTLIRKESKNGPSFSLTVSNLTPGTYLVVAVDGTTQYQGQMIVNH